MMRTWYVLGLSVCLTGAAFAASNHTITVDGDLSDWAADESFSGNDGVTYYITWDDDYVYVGADGINTADGDEFSVAFYMFDQNGTTGQANSVDFASNIAASYYFQLENGGNLWSAVGTGGSWASWTNQSGSWQNFAGWSGNNNSEVRVPRSFLNHTADEGEWGVVFMGENDASSWTWGTAPTANPTGGSVPNTMTNIYYWGSMDAGVNISGSASDTSSPTDVENWEKY